MVGSVEGGVKCGEDGGRKTRPGIGILKKRKKKIFKIQPSSGSIFIGAKIFHYDL